jgi:hypothetical protein
MICGARYELNCALLRSHSCNRLIKEVAGSRNLASSDHLGGTFQARQAPDSLIVLAPTSIKANSNMASFAKRYLFRRPSHALVTIISVTSAKVVRRMPTTRNRWQLETQPAEVTDKSPKTQPEEFTEPVSTGKKSLHVERIGLRVKQKACLRHKEVLQP